MLRLTTTLNILLISSLSAFAQDGLSAPRIGTVLAADGFLRDIEGVPGACRFVQAHDTTRYLAFNAASHGPLMLAATGEAIVITGYGTRRFTLSAPPRAMALSPKGLYFAVAAGDALTIYSLNDPDILPKPTPLVDLQVANGPLTLAVSDQGVALLADSNHVALAGSAASTPPQVPGTLLFPRFVPASALAVAYSPSENALVLVHADTLAIERLLTVNDGLAVPTGIEISKDAITVWISQTASNSVLSYSLETRSSASFDLGSPGALRSIGLPGVFLWNDTALLDAQRSAPQVLLIATETVN